MRKGAVVIAAAALSVWAGCVFAQPAPSGAPARSGRPPDACFNARMINGFTAPDDETVYIRVGVSEIYRLKLVASCPNMSWDQRIALQNRSGSTFICNALDAEVLAHDPGMGLQHCPVSEIRKLTPAEVAALPKKARP